MVINRKIRAFIAIPIPEEILRGLEIGQDALRETGITASFPRVSSLHVTLKFLGDITSDQVFSIKRILEERISGFQPFDIAVRGLGVFPSASRPRVAWAGLGAGDSLMQLHKDVEAAMQSLGFEPENRKFSPHITLARIKSSRNLDMLEAVMKTMSDFEMGTFPVGEIRLYQSILGSGGAVYKALCGAEAAGMSRSER